MCQPSSVMSNGSPLRPASSNWVARGNSLMSMFRPMFRRFAWTTWHRAGDGARLEQ